MFVISDEELVGESAPSYEASHREATGQGFGLHFSFFSIVIQDEVSILFILPQRLRSDLKVCSSIAPDAKISLSQDSVSAHSFLAISSLECISARLWGYCASVILANTLD